MPSDPAAEKGLTLIELLVTLTILGLLAVVAVEAFRIGGRAWENGERRAEEQQRLRVLYASLARDLASLQPISAVVQGKRLLGFSGKPDRLMFFSAPDGEGPLPVSAMTRGLAYFVEPGKGLLVQESHPIVEGAVSLEPKETRVKVLDPRAEWVRFRYLVADKDEEGASKWVEEWDSPEAPAAGRGVRPVLGAVPLAVEVTVSLSNGEQPATTGKPQPLTFYLPVRVGRRL